MEISQHGLNLIATYEGFPYHGEPYWDPYGRVWTQGYGDTKGVTAHSPRITQQQALENLKRRLHEDYEPSISALGIHFNQNQWDALCSIVWNLGVGILSSSHDFGRLLREGHLRAAADSLLEYDRAANGQVLAGLQRRREGERALFLTPVHSDPLAILAPSERRAVRAYDTLLHEHHNKDAIVKARATIAVLRKILWRRSQPKNNGGDGLGWNYNHRSQRYKILSSRTQNG